MKFVRFRVEKEGAIRSGILTEATIKEITGDLFTEWDYTGNQYPLVAVRLDAPLVPTQIIGIGANYVAAMDDLPDMLPDIPVFFFKPVTSVIGPGASIVIPSGLDEVKFESELAVVIGKAMKDVEEEKVLDHIFGYTVGNDVTAPQWFHQDGHWTLGKAFDSFTPLGPVIETDLDPDAAVVAAYLNGVKKQDSPTSLMIIPLRKMISYLSKVMTLPAGTVILTGAPLGADFLHDGDVIECTIEGIGTLKNRVIRVVHK